MAVPAAIARAGLVAWRHRRPVTHLLVGILTVAAGAMLLLVAVIAAAIDALIPSDGGGAITSPPGVPTLAVPWLGVINAAAAAYKVNPYLLVSVLEEETNYGTHPATYGLNFAGCCRGPFQFNVTDGPPSTWDTVRNAYRAAPRPASYPHEGEPHPSPDDSFDAAMGAAMLLRHKVSNRGLDALDDTAWEAACGYYGCDATGRAYADRVLERARRYQAAARASRDLAPPLPTGFPGIGAPLSWPVRGPVVSPWGPRWGRMHHGIDIAVPAGTVVAAAEGGVVVLADWVFGYGNYVCVRHSLRLTTCYAHLSAYAVRSDQPIGRGTPIGRSGCTGRCFGDHLHFEVRLGPASTSPSTDPIAYLR